MVKKKITLSTQEELRIFMSPQRQKLIRIMSIQSQAMTAKEIADQMNISASSVQMHIRKLAKLGIVEKDHTERINGITATYYRLAEADVNIGLEKSDDLFLERDTVAQNLLMQVYKNGRDTIRRASNLQELPEKELGRQYGSIRMGVFHLSPEDAKRLEDFITAFIEEKHVPREGTVPWEFAYIAYNTKAGGKNDA